jgi:tetratricopeptide (TPR) repeat protein
MCAICWAVRTVSAPAQGLDPRAAQTSGSEARFRCLQLAQILACAEALSTHPNDPVLLVAEGDALLRSERPGEAIGVYRNALRSGASRDVIDPRISEAQAHRQPLLEACRHGAGETADRACEGAWLPGAPDEVTVFKRRGALLAGDGRRAASLDAYLAAARLAPHDRSVARAIVVLTDGLRPADAYTMMARGAALLTLGRRAQAIDALREASRMAPSLTLARERLQTALRRPPAQRRRLASTQPPAPRPALVGGDASAAATAAAATAAGRVFSNEAEDTRSH